MLDHGPRPRHLLLAAGLLALTACGGAQDDPVVVSPGAADEETTAPGQTPTGGTSTSGTASGTASMAPGEVVEADLTVTVDDGSGRVTEVTLTCEPPGGSAPDPNQACRGLAAAWQGPLQPVPDGMTCTEQFGGPQTATMTGTVAGEPVKTEFNRTNGCEIERWNALEALIGPVADPDV